MERRNRINFAGGLVVVGAENWWDQMEEGMTKMRNYRKMTGIGGIWELMWKPIVGETSWNLQGCVPSEDSYLDMEDMVPNLVIFCNRAWITKRKLGHKPSDKTSYLQFALLERCVSIKVAQNLWECPTKDWFKSRPMPQ